MKVSLLFLWLCSFSIYLSDNHNHICEEYLSNNCDFSESIAHGIHSLTLQDLRYYFDENAPTHNLIPSINFDLSSPDLLFNSTPYLQLNNSFKTPAMNSVDHILSNWERDDFMMKHGGVLEKLVHNLHMYETLTMSGKVYEKIVKKMKKKSMKEKMGGICSCINEKDSSIVSLLEIMASSMRDGPEEEGGHEDHEVRKIPDKADCKWRVNEYGNYDDCCKNIKYKDREYCKTIRYTEEKKEIIHEKRKGGKVNGCNKFCKLKHNDRSCNNRHLIVDPGHVHEDGSSDYVQPLRNSSSWNDWKDHLNVPDEQQWNFNLAVYIYCKLN